MSPPLLAPDEIWLFWCPACVTGKADAEKHAIAERLTRRIRRVLAASD
jgi:hypothetical protein